MKAPTLLGSGLLFLSFSCSGIDEPSLEDESPDTSTSTGGAYLNGSGGADNGAALGSGGSDITATGGSSPAASGGAASSGGSPTDVTDTGGTSAGTGGEAQDVCPFAGSITYQLNSPESWPENVEALITEAMDGALSTYNCYADLTKSITVNYNPGVPTAEANVDGWLSFGSNTGYMQVATAMHEIAHTLGVGYSPWTELMDNGLWTGEAVTAFMESIPPEQRDPDEYAQRTYIRGDAQHFWPYGLNQAAEHQSKWSLINHVRIVAAIQEDKSSFLATP